MPVASSSRRNTARRPPSEDIEEANSTQPAPDEEMDEGDSQSRRIAKVKKEKTKIHKGQAKQEIKNSGSYNEDDDRIDVANFQDQPLGRADLTKLKGMAGDWGNIRQSVQTQSLNLVADIARSVAEYANGEDKEKELAELEGIMKEMIDLEEEMLCHEKVVDEIYQLVAQEEAIDDAVSRYQDGAKLKMAIYGKKTTRQKYAKSERFATFKQGIYEADHPGGAMPPLTEFIPREPGDESDDDDDLEIGGVTQDYKCPITLTHLNNPYTSTVCQHSFSGEAIREFFGGRPQVERKCPTSGCNKSFKLSDCKPDKDLAKRVKAAARRAQRDEEHSDGEEVVE